MRTLYHFTMAHSLESVMQTGIVPAPLPKAPLTERMAECGLEAVGSWLWPAWSVSAEVLRDFLRFKQGCSGVLLECRVSPLVLLSDIYEARWVDRLSLTHSLDSNSHSVAEGRTLKTRTRTHHQALDFDICIATIPPGALRKVATIEVVVSTRNGFEFDEHKERS